MDVHVCLQTMAQSENLPSVSQMHEMEEDLLFKEEEMKRAAATADSLETRMSHSGLRNVCYHAKLSIYRKH